MKITLDFNKEEIEELAKMVYIAQCVVGRSDRYPELEVNYPQMAVFEKTAEAVYKVCFEAAPESILYSDEGYNSEATYNHTVKMEDELDDLMESFVEQNQTINICDAITQRLYTNLKGGEDDKADFELWEGIFESTKQKIKTRGLKNLYFKDEA